MWIDYCWRLNSGVGNRIHHEATKANLFDARGMLPVRQIFARYVLAPTIRKANYTKYLPLRRPVSSMK